MANSHGSNQQTGTEQIDQLIGKIAKLESERDAHRTRMEAENLFDENYHSQLVDNPRYSFRYRRLNEMNEEIGREQQKLISLELGSIDDYSMQFNKNIGALNESVKSLNDNTQKLLKSSKNLEILTNILIFVAIVSISVALIPLNPYYALLIPIAVAYFFLSLVRRVFKRKGEGKEQP